MGAKEAYRRVLTNMGVLSSVVAQYSWVHKNKKWHAAITKLGAQEGLRRVRGYKYNVTIWEDSRVKRVGLSKDFKTIGEAREFYRVGRKEVSS